MKTLRQLFVASLFTLALTTFAFAGEISTPLAPPQPAQATTSTAGGDISTGLTGQEETGSGEVSATDSATGIALNLLRSVLAVF
jgi:hypothetical protein